MSHLSRAKGGLGALVLRRAGPRARNDQPMFEYACHEGNYGLTNILAGSRAEEARGAER